MDNNDDIEELLNNKWSSWGLTFGLSEYPLDFVATRDMTMHGGNYYSYKDTRPIDFSLGKRPTPRFKGTLIGQITHQQKLPATIKQSITSVSTETGRPEIIISCKPRLMKWRPNGLFPDQSNMALKVELTRLDSMAGGLGESRVKTTKETCNRVYILVAQSYCLLGEAAFSGTGRYTEDETDATDNADPAGDGNTDTGHPDQ
ncbi:hypothetical protein B0H15DRAFT_807096 [Mycena belliarum]|uniref:Uncharacterized protein n=1 Tax=Mycena belliarum TaxID=1033014 RepID=A0AAD6TPH8_9AGAR|nr:hypothetical protein B0H15DRAFT_807096 [Mycena belliae]